MTTQSSTLDALERILDPFRQSLDAQAAKRIVDFRLDPSTLDRIDELANRCNEGLLSDEERSEYEGYVQGVGLLDVLRAKASLAISTDQP